VSSKTHYRNEAFFVSLVPVLRNFKELIDGATVNQHPSVHHEGWMVSGQETAFYWVPVP